MKVAKFNEENTCGRRGRHLSQGAESFTTKMAFCRAWTMMQGGAVNFGLHMGPLSLGLYTVDMAQKIWQFDLVPNTTRNCPVGPKDHTGPCGQHWSAASQALSFLLSLHTPSTSSLREET